MATRFTDHLLTGDHASRPAFGAVPQGTLYACSDHGLIYQSDGTSAWSTWADISGTGGSGSITASGYTQATARLLGRTTASAGAIEEITVGSGLSLSAGALTATGGATHSAARVHNSGNIALTNGSYTTITFDTEDEDTDGYHSTVTNTERFTIAAAGWYRLGCGMNIAGAGDPTSVFVEIVKNAGAANLAVDSRPGVSGTSRNVAMSTYCHLAAADYVWVRIFVNQTSQSAMVNGDQSPVFWIELAKAD